MAKTIGRNSNTTDSATLPGAFTVTASTSLKIADANTDRIFFCVNNNNASDGLWIKLQAASVDNTKKGIFIPSKGSWQMPTDNVYTGEISAIGDNTDTETYITEY